MNNFKIYNASAGSGKTFTLVREYLALSLGARPEERKYRKILAITFTNAAANDMKAKILEHLRNIMAGRSRKSEAMMNAVQSVIRISDEELTARADIMYNDIIHNYSDFNISTIDSFVQNVSRPFAKEMKLPSQYSVLIDSDDLVDAVMQSVSDDIEHEKFISDVLTDFASNMMDDKANWRIERDLKSYIADFLKESVDGSASDLVISQDDYKEVEKYLMAFVSHFDTEIKNYVETLPKMTESNDNFYQKNRGLPSIINRIRGKEGCNACNNYVEAVFSDYSKEKKLGGNRDKIIDAYREAADYYNENILKYKLFKYIHSKMYLIVLRPYLIAKIDDFMVETGKVHLSEFNKRLSDILGDFSVPFIYERTGERFDNYFIDEFQDTSVLQWHNMLPLFDNALPQNGCLVVGDAKQAIYRFRGGEVKQIMNLPQIFDADASNPFIKGLQNKFDNEASLNNLDRNFRSAKKIVEFNNSFFAELSKKMNTHDGNDECVDNDISTVYNIDEKSSNYFCQKPVREDDGYVCIKLFSADNEGENKYSDWTHEKVFKDIKMLVEEKGYAFRDIAILTRGRASASRLASFLSTKEAGGRKINVVSEDSLLLSSSPHVQFLITALKCLNKQDDNVTKSSFVYLYDKCANKNVLTTSVFDEYKMSFDKLAAPIKNLPAIYNVYDLCCEIIRSYDFLSVKNDVFVQYFLENIFEWQSHNIANIDDFLDYWEQKKSMLSIQISSDVDAVRIMTIHKSKGLEFKVVMYPFAFYRIPEMQKTSNEKWFCTKDFEETKDIPHLKSFPLKITKKEFEGTRFMRDFDEENARQKFDDVNLLYVAMTRPKDMLFVYSKASDNSPFSVLKDMTDVMQIVEDENDCVAYEMGSLDDKKREEDKENDKKYCISTDCSKESNVNWKDSLTFSDGKQNDYIQRGNDFHSKMEKIRTVADVSSFENDADFELIRKIVTHESLKDAFSSKALVRNESAVIVPNAESGVMEIRPDHYAELSDRIIIIDYKTGDEKKTAYERQLNAYAAAVANMSSKKILKYIVYVDKESGNVSVTAVD